MKSVQTEKPDSSGSWATALRWRFNCSKKTIQALAWSSYDREGKFIKSGSTPGIESAAVPDSIGEGTMKVACQTNFPNDTSANSKYVKIQDNDVFAATRRMVEYKKSQTDNAPK